MTEESAVPFYLMNPNKLASDKQPIDKREIVSGIESAIKATKRRIYEYKKDGANTSDLEVHLKNLEAWLERERKK